MLATTVTPNRLAEIAQRAAELIVKYGFSREYLIDPTQGKLLDGKGALGVRGAVAVAVGLPPLTDNIFTPSMRHDRRVRELNALDTAFGDFLALPDVDECHCGGHHDNRALRWESDDERTEDDVVDTLRRFASAQHVLAGYDAGLGYDEPTDWDAFTAMLNGQSGGQTG